MVILIFRVLQLYGVVKEQQQMNVLLPAPCGQIHVPLVLENPLTGTRCIVDAKVDTGSFATVISSTTMEKMGLMPFTEDWVELANGEAAQSDVCMCRVHLSGNIQKMNTECAGCALNII